VCFFFPHLLSNKSHFKVSLLALFLIYDDE
jgi:hypothetical protein